MDTEDIKNLSSTGGQPNIPEQPPKTETTSRQDFDNAIEQRDREINLLKTAWDSQAKNIVKIEEGLKKHSEDLKNLGLKIGTYEERVRNTELRSIEVIGIISSIIALVLAFIDTANAQRNLKDSFSILIVGASSLVLFAVLLHNFFNKEDKKHWTYYVFAIGLPIVVILMIGFLIFFR